MFYPVEKRGAIFSEILFPVEFLERPAPESFSPVHISKKESYTMRDVFYESFERRSRRTRPSTGVGFLAQLGAAATHYVSKERLRILKFSEIRILVTTGTIDHLVNPANSHYLAKELGCRLHVFEGAGHVLLFQEREKFNMLLEEHINGESRGITSEE